ncbi:MAG: phosphate ABC transporter permease family protein, partial [Reinekea sp.]|nr:phosphate ABC transporter permease family protein [Reinekea sp.]
MQPVNLFFLIAALIVTAYVLGYFRSRALAQPLGGIRHLKSLPGYYAVRAAMWCGIPALIVLVMWASFDNKVIQLIVLGSLAPDIIPGSEGEASLLMSQISNVASGALAPGSVAEPLANAADLLTRLRESSGTYMTLLVLSIAMLAGFVGWYRIQPRLNAREQVEKILRWFFFSCAALAILTTVGIIFSVFFETIRFFGMVPFTEFFFGTSWSPQVALRADQVGSGGAFGMIPLFTGTLLISAIALLVAVPVGLFSAIYLSEYANKHVRSVVKPLLELLAGVPTVVYGFFAALTVAPFIANFADTIGIGASSQSALAAGLVMGIMIIP